MACACSNLKRDPHEKTEALCPITDILNPNASRCEKVLHPLEWHLREARVVKMLRIEAVLRHERRHPELAPVLGAKRPRRRQIHLTSATVCGHEEGAVLDPLHKLLLPSQRLLAQRTQEVLVLQPSRLASRVIIPSGLLLRCLEHVVQVRRVNVHISGIHNERRG